MPFPYAEICTLLQRLEHNERENVLPRDRSAGAKEIVERWFHSHRKQINELNVDSSCALLSTLLPEWHTDRVYGTQAVKLSRTISRALQLSLSNRKTLEAYTQPAFGDLGTCLERILRAFGPPALPAVTVEEVDDLLQDWAGLCAFSDPRIPRPPRSSSGMRDETLANILKRIHPEHGKWLARLILKNYSPVQVDDHLILKNFHFLLPDLLRFQRDFRAVVTILKQQLREYPECPDPRSERLFRRQLDAGVGIRPVVGTKIGRPNFDKAFSIDMCLRKLGMRNWVVERKYDGEYCEIHVDLSKSRVVAECIKIFSKSGKESTQDKVSIIPTLVQCLRLGKDDCRFRKHAILLGELVVFSDEQDQVLPFDEIRKHVTRSGRRLGGEEDSPPKADEHLAIVFFDLLLLDDEVVLKRPVEERRMWLRGAYKKIHGRAMGAEWKQIDFSDRKGKKRLVDQFAASNARRCEGLVLKPCGMPYISLEAADGDHYIKLKKDYILGLGDECDFAVIGASYNAQLAATTGLKNVKWTTFHLGCLVNKEDVRRRNMRPVFKHVATVECEHCIPRAVLEAANFTASFRALPYGADHTSEQFDIETMSPLSMSHTLYPPLTFEVLGSGYEKPSNCSFLMLRHPRVKKLHEDRPWEDCVSFEELQQQGAASRAAPPDSESQETRRWIERVERGCKAKLERDKTISPKSRATITPTRSPVSLSQRPSPRRPSAKRSSTGLPTPFPSSGIAKLPSSPLTGSAAVPRQMTSNKRQHDEDGDVPVVDTTKKARLHHSRIHQRTPMSSSPLIELSSNAGTTKAQASAHSHRHSTDAINVATKPGEHMPPSVQINPPPSHVQSVATCRSSNCPFAQSTVFLAPCITHTPYITDDLLRTHAVSLTRDLLHWDRDSFARPCLAECVSESQSDPGMRKVVLVERKRRGAVRSTLQHILRLNGGCFRETIDVYDWRVLEECQAHDRGADVVTRHFLGATLFDEAQGRAGFVANGDSWLEEE